MEKVTSEMVRYLTNHFMGFLWTGGALKQQRIRERFTEWYKVSESSLFLDDLEKEHDYVETIIDAIEKIEDEGAFSEGGELWQSVSALIEKIINS